MLHGQRRAAGMVGDEVHDPPPWIALALWLLVQRGLRPSRSGELEQWPRQEIPDRVQGDLPVRPVVVVAVRPEERRGEVEYVFVPYDYRGTQRSADRCLGVAREVLPRPVEESAAQLPERRCASERANQM